MKGAFISPIGPQHHATSSTQLHQPQAEAVWLNDVQQTFVPAAVMRTSNRPCAQSVTTAPCVTQQPSPGAITTTRTRLTAEQKANHQRSVHSHHIALNKHSPLFVPCQPAILSRVRQHFLSMEPLLQHACLRGTEKAPADRPTKCEVVTRNQKD
jgi:hypothetical protein